MVSSSIGFNTVFGVANPSATLTATVTTVVYSPSGVAEGKHTFTLAAHHPGQWNLYSGRELSTPAHRNSPCPGITGMITISATNPVIVTGAITDIGSKNLGWTVVFFPLAD
jgi:hypothetical protein